MDRRSLILTAAFGTAVPSIVKAESLIGVPGDPLTRRGLFAASKWAEETFRTNPAARLVFADGQATGWMEYQALSRNQPGTPKYGLDRTYAVAIEVSATDAAGKRFVTSVPIDAKMCVEHENKRLRSMREAQTRREMQKQDELARLDAWALGNRPSSLIGSEAESRFPVSLEADFPW